MAASSPRPLVGRLLRASLRLYDWRLGWLLGHRFLRLTHTGRRSGHRHDSVLEVIAHDRARGQLVVLAGPVVRRVLSRLVGWRYDGSAPARRRLVRELRFVACDPDLPERGPAGSLSPGRPRPGPRAAG